MHSEVDSSDFCGNWTLLGQESSGAQQQRHIGNGEIINSRLGFPGLGLDNGFEDELQQKLLSNISPTDISTSQCVPKLSSDDLKKSDKQQKKRSTIRSKEKQHFNDDTEHDDDQRPAKKVKVQENDITNESNLSPNQSKELCDLDDNFAQQCTFPKKLMELLDNEVARDALWWLPEGEAFAIEPKKFAHEVLDKSFQGTKFESFIRKLNRWGFKRMVGKQVPPDAIAYCHTSFKKGKAELLNDMSGRKKKEKKGQRGSSQNELQGDALSGLSSMYSQYPASYAQLLTTDQVLDPMNLRRVDQQQQMDRDLLLQSMLMQQQRADMAFQQRQALLAAERQRLAAAASGQSNVSAAVAAADLRRKLNIPSTIVSQSPGPSSLGQLSLLQQQQNQQQQQQQQQHRQQQQQLAAHENNFSIQQLMLLQQQRMQLEERGYPPDRK